jgi:uncharacterized protein
MDITPAIATGRQVIQSYGSQGFRIGDKVYLGPALVLPDRVLEWQIGNLQNLSLADFAPLLSEDPRVEAILLGCGAVGIFIPPALRAELRQAGTTIDAMDTGAACRTYNVMLSEERRIAAALIPS